ncbi:MAG: NTP transferase domain-containing protein [Christensenellales bacterium]
MSQSGKTALETVRAAQGVRVDGLVLAAGSSSRTAPAWKLALPFFGQTLLEASIGSLRPYCREVYVVTGAHAGEAREILAGQPGVTLLHNPEHAAGMYGSIKAGLRHIGGDAVLLLPGDCPFVAGEVIQALLAAPGDIVLPTWQGEPGHPVLLRRGAVLDLLRDEGARTLRQFLAARSPTLVAAGCPGILQDIDTLMDYRQAVLARQTAQERA